LSTIRAIFALIPAALLLAAASDSPEARQTPGTAAPVPEVRESTRHDTSPELRQMPQIPPQARPGVAKPPRRLPNRFPDGGTPGDGALQEASAATNLATIGVNFDGVNNVDGVLPPDTNGDVGPNHFVQTVNLSYRIWNKSGSPLNQTADVATLWQGFGGPCANNNDGDPIVLYDHLADRWTISQFALPNFPSGPFYQCIAVSQGGDPLGAYHRYEFKISDTKLNDYPKFGVWGDGYYMSINQFTCSQAFPFGTSCQWGGQGAVVFERDRMLSGQTARMIYFDLLNTDANLGGMLPADLDGPAPAAGTPNPFALFDDDAWGYSPDQLQIWEFKTNWATPANSSFTRKQTLPTAAFDSDMCGYARNCIPQGGTSVKVDAISDRLMFRLQYRTFGGRQTLVTNHTVDVGSDRAGIRWYELSNFGTDWSISQQATYAPADGLQRWTGSMAMNGAGHIAVGYSASSGSVAPSVRAAGRLPGDPLGQLSQGEITLYSGGGSQTHSSGRWGDYSMLAVDPVDDCTFWYTTEYYSATASSSWRTRVASFKLAECGGATNNTPTVSFQNPASGTVAGSVAIRIDASDEDPPGTLSVQWNVDGGTWLPATYNTGSGFYEALWNSTSSPDGPHTLNARATDSGGKTGTASISVTSDNVPDSGMVHVGDLDGSSTAQGNTWTATVAITVHDAGHAPVANAVLTGSWSNGATGTASCTTDATGRCSVSKAGLAKRTSSVTFSVTNVAPSVGTYSSSANHDPESDSNGTAITVRKS
jgi:hypothetical protein